MASAHELGGAAAAVASVLWASGGSEGGGRARVGKLRGSRASSTSSRPARGAVRASRACGGHAAATFWSRSAMTGLIFAFQSSTIPTDKRSLTVINS